MTTFKLSTQPQIIFDFSPPNYSKAQIKQALRELKIRCLEYNLELNSNILINNVFKIGMYELHIETAPIFGLHKIRDFSELSVSFYETGSNKYISWVSDGRFKNQSWAIDNALSQLSISQLVDIIYHCKRLNKLNAFI